jgi:hypothetical protein
MVLFEYAGNLIKKGYNKLREGLSSLKNKLGLSGSGVPRALPPATPEALPPGEPSILKDPPEGQSPYREPGVPTSPPTPESPPTPDPTPKDPWSRVEPEIDKKKRGR